jgi:tRNA A-37 threonylcarbamoyl transferase component Bud32
MSTISELKRCPKCGGPIPAEAPQGLCPRCLLLQVCVPTEAGHNASAKSPPPTHEGLAAAFPQLEILELIGQGGMGFVFKARQPKIERLVALKILPQSLAADPAFAERFTREGRMLARLNHPNIVTIHDFGQAGGFFYLLMEFVDGVNLRQAMKVGRFTPAQALAVVPKICEALQFAHNEGILHRDIKPENILLDSKGRVKIADFGIAKLVGEPHTDSPLTGSGAVLGTPHYMAPEQLEKSGEVDQRADIYSLGVVFYEMLTGELPLGRFQPPSKKVQVDVRLDEVVLHALEKEPARRYQQVSQVKTAVETISGSPAGPAAPVGAPPLVAAAAAPAQRPDRFWRWFGVVVLSLMLSLIVIPVGIAVAGILAAMLIPALTKARGPAQHQHSMAQPGKTVVLTGATNELLNATNNLRFVRVHSDSTLLPGETLVGLTTLPDGRTVEDGSTSFFIHRHADSVQTSTYFSWSLADSFGPEEFESAAMQLQQNYTGRPIEVPQGKPMELFSVTNKVGGIVRGSLRFERFVPGTASASVEAGTEAGATVRLRSYGGGLLAFYTASVPPGYFLEAADNSSELGEGEAFTSINNGSAGSHSSWSPPRSFTYEQQREAVAQLQRLAEQGPIRVAFGEPFQVFSITNTAGEVYKGCFELVGPPAPAKRPDPLPPNGRSSATVPSLALPAPEGKLVLDTEQSQPAHPEPGELDWGFKCFVPPGHLASILFVRWTNGVPQVDLGFSGYFKVGKAGGIDIPFCSLSCYRIIETQFWRGLNEDQRRQALANWRYPESSGVTNAVRWDVNLGLGFTGSRWMAMPPYHGVKLQLPQSLRSGHQRVIRLLDFHTPEGNASQGQSGVELRIFLEPLKSPPIRMVPNEVDHTNYIAGTGLAGTMEEALRAIKEWPTDP